MFFKYISTVHHYIFQDITVKTMSSKKSTVQNDEIEDAVRRKTKSEEQMLDNVLSKAIDHVCIGSDIENKLFEQVDIVLDSLRNSAKSLGYVVSVELGGSAAKRTFLKGDFDCDVFVRFDFKKYSGKDSELSGYLKKIILGAGHSPVELHGSRNYFQFVSGGFKFELVPVLWIESISDAKNVTDASPFHVYWFNEKCKKSGKDPNHRFNNQVRLAKLFSKSQRVYGAESYIQGFSGHVIDILIVHFKSFRNLVEYFASVDEILGMKKYDERKIVIDVENFYPGKTSLEIQKILNPSKIDSPLIVIDPISKDRNASSSIGVEKFNQFIRSCKKFLGHPDDSFFEKKSFSDSLLKERLHELKSSGLSSYSIICKVNPLKGKKDIVGAKIMKLAEYLANKLVENSFKLYDYDFELVKKASDDIALNDSEDFSESYIWFFVDVSELEKEFLWAGPPESEKNHAESFLKKHKKILRKNGRLYAEITREHTDAFNFIKTFKEDGYVLERCKGISFRKCTL